jgi:hypothetical protein
VVERTDERWYEAELYRLMAEALITKSDRQDAERWLRRALQTAQKQGARLWELRAATSLARLGAIKASAPTPATCSRRSTAASPKASIPRPQRSRRATC